MEAIIRIHKSGWQHSQSQDRDWQEKVNPTKFELIFNFNTLLAAIARRHKSCHFCRF